LEDVDYRNVLSDRLVEMLRKGSRFGSVVNLSGGSSASADAVLTVRISHWGLVTGMGTNYNQRAQPALDSTVTLAEGASGKSIWKRTDFYPGGTVHDVNEYTREQGLLRKDLEEMFRRYGDRVANEIRYSN
jgi:hypothetical protein